MYGKRRVLAEFIALLFVIIACGRAGNAVREHMLTVRETTASAAEGTLIILDPGHGGADAGKTGENGAEEKTINLRISLITKKYLEEQGISVILTRKDDDRLADTQKQDLRERVHIINEEKPVLAVSIHQNSYQGTGVRGPQVFYYPDSEKGRKAAETVQAELNSINEDYTREIKSNASYYILKNADVPAVIAECGFLSNPEEAELLVDEEYQETLARAIAKGIRKYIQSK